MDDTKDREEGALSRWSRLKRETGAVPAAPEADGEQATAGRPPDIEAAENAEEPPAEEDEETVRIEDLPDVETLTYESDFTAFMRKGVPEELQRLALHKLWRSSPVLANLDGLNDYDLDYNKLGADTRVTEALLSQRQAKERALREGRPAAEPGPSERVSKTPPAQAKAELPEAPDPESAPESAPELAPEAAPEPAGVDGDEPEEKA